MTIALGLLAADGMVFATDTEESWGEHADIKTATTKMLSGMVARDERTGCSFAVAGAGNSDLLQSVKLELVDNVMCHKEWSYETAGTLTEEYLLRFYRRHVRPYWPHIEDFQLLIGVSHADQVNALWGTTQATLRPCMFGYEAIGAGRPYATALLSRLHHTTLGLSSASLLAVYAILCVKELIGGCGKATRLVTLSGLTVNQVDPKKIDEVERILKRWFALDSYMLDYVFSHGDDPKHIMTTARSLRSELAAVKLLE